jgi:streptogramin lyase
VTRYTLLRLERALLVLSMFGGTAACGSGYSSVGTVPTSSPAANTGTSLAAKTYAIGANVNVLGITSGADGNVWFSECPDANGGGAIAKMTTSAILTVYPLPDGAVACPKWLTLGKDRAVWFTEEVLNGHHASQLHIGRIDTGGNITEFALPAGDSAPDGIIVGGDGNIWYDATVASGASTVAVLRGFSPTTRLIIGSVTLSPVVTLSTTNNTLRVNPTDGALIVASDSVTRVVPGPSPRPSQPFGIPTTRRCSFMAASKDGYLYLQCNASILAQASQTTYHTAYIGEPATVALSSGLTPVGFAGPMAFGSDAYLYLWGTLGTPPAPALFAMSTSGLINAFYLDANVNDRPVDAVLGADGAMWFTISNGTRGVVVRVAPYQTSRAHDFRSAHLRSRLRGAGVRAESTAVGSEEPCDV